MRHQFWRWGTIVLMGLSWGLVLWLALPQTDAIAAAADPEILHVLNRVGFGPRPGDIDHVRSVGIEEYLQEQLNPQSLAYPPDLKQQLREFSTLAQAPAPLFQTFEPTQIQQRQGKPKDPAERRAMLKKSRQPTREAMQARLLRAIASPRQLEEVMVNFWFNHFNVSAAKGWGYLWVGAYEQDAIRPYVLGSFRELLGATARHPAMLYYLDNWQNTVPKGPNARGRFKGLNENYARELLELHTLGVDGGYTQADVIAAAKVFTGWGLSRVRRQWINRNGFYFDPKRHDFSDKVFLGTSIPGKGLVEGEQVLDILARHPTTARHISYKLAQYFVADEPPSSLVNRLAKRFQATDGNIRAVLESLFQSEEFWDPQYRGNKFKTPYEYVLSLTRAIGDTRVNLQLLGSSLQQFSMPLYRCSTPDGYANTQAEWLNPDAITRRISLATAMARGMGRQDRKAANADQLDTTLGVPFSAQTRTVLDNSPQSLRAALMLGSPELMYR